MEGFGRVNGVMIGGADTRGLARNGAPVFGASIDPVAGDGHMVDLIPNDLVPLLRVQRVPDQFCVIGPSEAS